MRTSNFKNWKFCKQNMCYILFTLTPSVWSFPDTQFQVPMQLQYSQHTLHKVGKTLQSRGPSPSSRAFSLMNLNPRPLEPINLLNESLYPPFSRAFAKLRKKSISFVMSVCTHVNTLLPIQDFHGIAYVSFFSKICRENWSCIKI